MLTAAGRQAAFDAASAVAADSTDRAVAMNAGTDASDRFFGSGAELAGLLDGLEGSARQDRAELIAWLLDRGFTVDQIGASHAPMLLPSNRVMGEDGRYVSAREVAECAHVDVELLQRLQRAAGLPRIDDPDAAILPRVDAEAAARTTFFLDFGLDPDEAVAVIRVLVEGLSHTAAILRETSFRVMVKPGATEVELARSAEELTQDAVPRVAEMVEGLMLLQLRHMFETQGISAAERAAGQLPGAQPVAVAFADLAGFTGLGEVSPPEDLQRLACRLSDLAHDVVSTPVWFVKTIGDAVMLVCPEPAALVSTVLELIEVAADNELPQLRAGVAMGPAVSRAGDWFGSPVNVASRVTGLAAPGTVVVTSAARQATGVAEGFEWSSVGAHVLRGVPTPVELFRVSRKVHRPAD
jgi:adenylate cyclase